MNKFIEALRRNGYDVDTMKTDEWIRIYIFNEIEKENTEVDIYADGNINTQNYFEASELYRILTIWKETMT